MALRLEQIIPWGRTRQEYERMFALSREDLSRGLLDCGGGRASFVAELSATGHSAVAVAPVFWFQGPAIRARRDAMAGPFPGGVHASPGFHMQTVRAWCRVANEVWNFPRLSLGRTRSPHPEAVQSLVNALGWSSGVARGDDDLQRGGSSMPRIVRNPPGGRRAW